MRETPAPIQHPHAQAARMQLAWELYEAGVEITVHRLERQHPHATAAQRSALLRRELDNLNASVAPHLQPPACPRFCTPS